MAYKHITTAAATQVYQTAGAPNLTKTLITVNGALTGTITVTDQNTAGSLTNGTVAVITNPTVGSFYEYWDLQYGLLVTPNATCNITVNFTVQGATH